MKTRLMKITFACMTVTFLVFMLTGSAFGHCDSMDGPVITDARDALNHGDVTVVLKWVPQESENEIREAFDKTIIVRSKGQTARELADMYFFETLVRIHRAGEGAPYTGIKPSGTPVPAVVLKSDEALETGNVDELARRISTAVEAGIKKRFADALESREHQNKSIVEGRRFVADYVEYVHYVERIHDTAIGYGRHHGHQSEATENHQSHNESFSSTLKHEH